MHLLLQEWKRNVLCPQVRLLVCICPFVCFKTKPFEDFPGGPVVKNPPSNAEDVGSIPGRRTGIPHVTGQLSPCATTTELARHNYWARVPQWESPSAANYRAHVLWNPCATTTEPTHPGACVPQLERENLNATSREKPVHYNEEPACRIERSRMPQQRSHVLPLRPDATKNK